MQRRAKTARSERTPACPIVGVGASAGGLEAFTLLLKALPADTGMAFVLIQHLDPAHESELSKLLAKATVMPTATVKNKQRVEPNHVYVIPPNANLAIAKGVLKLEPRPKGGAPHHAIDFFFESLAQDQRERAIGVVLSGTATDGTQGLEAIKAEDGITFAQDDSAKYDSMPRSAVAAGCADFVLSPTKIAQELARIAEHPYVTGAAAIHSTAGEDERQSSTQRQDDATALPSGGHGSPRVGAKQARAETARRSASSEDDGYMKVLLLLRNHCGVDFSLYKSTTIQRRVARRMVLGKHENQESYARFLRGNAQELDTLFSDVLISVTSFFRNPEVFEILKRTVFPQIVERREEMARVWVLGCSTGQEAYSIGMAFAEFCDGSPRAPALQVFATDLNDALLDKARAGLYSKTLAADLSPERLRRFFVEEQGGYRVVKPLREAVVFARQNLISDPPFSRMDLISCRNLLIYLEPALQKKILPTFHYALRPGGYLLLGASESVGQFGDLFETVEKKHKLFSKKAVSTPVRFLPAPPSHPAEKRRRAAAPPVALDAARGELSAQREADRLSVNEFAPPGVLVDAQLRVIQFRGPTGAFLTPPSGKANFDLLKMAREGLLLPLRAALNKAKKEQTIVRKEGVRIQGDSGPRTVDLRVIPLKNLNEPCYLVLFEEALTQETNRQASAARRQDAAARNAGATPKQSEMRRRLAGAERELGETRDYLQAMQEQHDATHDALQASNEEVQSANEELQSINEELETSKEELESTNEELTTVNEEMANRNVEMSRLNADLSNLHLSINIAILLLGRDLTVRRFTPLAEKAFNLLAGDVGRSLRGIRHNLVDAATDAVLDLDELLRDVIDGLGPREREVRDQQGRWLLLRARPYLTHGNTIDGAVLMLTDIDDLKRGEQEAKAARGYSEAIIRTTREALVVLEADLRVRTANEAFYKLFKTAPEQTEGRLVYELGHGQWNLPKLRSLLEEILPRNSFFHDFEVRYAPGGGNPRTLLFNARRLDHAPGGTRLILLAIEDVSERLESRAALRASELRYRRVFEAAHDGILLIDPMNRKIIDANPYITELLGYSREELLGQELWQIGLLADEQTSHAVFLHLQRLGSIRYDDLPLDDKAGRRRQVEFVGNLYDEDGTKIIQFNVRDVTERKLAAAALARSLAELKSNAEELSRFNQVAVGRESRMIELKKEINELCRRQGEAARYPLGFEQDNKDE